MKITLIRLGLVALMVGGLAGCGGGGDGFIPPGGGGGGGTALIQAPVPPGNTTIDVATLPAAALALLEPQIVFGNAVVESAPQVSFAVQDPGGNPIIGLGKLRSQGDLEFLRFGFAKLVPGAPTTTTTTPSKWVSYIVLGSGSGGRPNVERTGTLVDNGNGTYVYTFATDVATVKDQIAALNLTPPDDTALGDLTYDPNLTHRLVIQLSSGGITNPVNGIYDFIPATANKVTATDFQRQVVSIDNCNECHNKLALHGSNRIDTQFCVICHTDQRRFGRTDVASTNLAFPALTETPTVDPVTGFTRYSYSPTTYVGDGETMGDFPRLVHKIHSGHDLLKQNYNYANFPFNLKHFSLLNEGQRMCTKCHDNTKAAQADNYKTVPSRIACGACHDGIDFATGTGTTLGGATTGHVGGAQANDSGCAGCHNATNIPVYHQTENITEHNPTVEPGLVNFTYEIKSATVDDGVTNDVTVVFKISADGVPLTSVAPPTGYSNRSAGFLLAWAVSQDAIATPADFNNTTNAKGDATSINIGAGTNNLLGNGNISGPDASGYFTATIPSARGFPVGAKMRTVAIQSYYQQNAGTNGIAADSGRHAISVVKTVTGDTERRKVIDPAKCGNCHEWLELHGGSRVIGKETMGNVIVCVTCHVPAKATSGRGIIDAVVNTYAAAGNFSAEDLGILAEWGVSPLTFPVTTGDTWALQLPVTSNNFKDMIHGIHKGRERVIPFRDARDRTGGTPPGTTGAITLLDFRRLDFPGIINQCETCHLPGSYSNVPADALPSTYESIDATYKATANAVNAKAALSQPNPEDMVTTPFAATCVACHDSTAAKAHMQTAGGAQIMVERQNLLVANESCVICHGVGRDADIAKVHNK
ncbi:MAG: OmcA/MtrC family decaheme c-type cytochrome [Gammaproteobacteria bacterium]|nr:OmcA/MtrC family decaheme c-type cytochrome [Gammaproteobacteria bacterium]